MQYRELGRTGWKVSTISFGAWAIGGGWGTVDDKISSAAIARRPRRKFHRHGRVYGDGRAAAGKPGARKRGRFTHGHKGREATQSLPGHNRENLVAFVEQSLKNLGVGQSICCSFVPANDVTFGRKSSRCWKTWSGRNCGTTA
jgi:aryl-alcohol dehydrogenase-like predicted oxidoreductase